MKNMKNMKKYNMLIVFVTCLFISCSDSYLEKYPIHSPASTDFPKSGEELEIALIGVYNSLYKKTAGYMQDELFWDNATDLGFVRGAYENTEGILTGSVSSRIFDAHWIHRYKGIQRANLILENMEIARERINSSVCDQVEAEARFIRAYHYMHLIERFGDVPYIETSLTISEANLPRTEKAVIVKALLDDLENAAQVLPQTQTGNDSGKATKGAAYALKARIALYNGEYEIARNAALEVMSLGYSLHPDYGDLFQLAGNGSPEIIFQLSYHPDVQVNTDYIFFGGKGGGTLWSTAVPTTYLVDSYLCVDGKSINESPLYDQEKPFENRDPRLKQSIIVPQTWFGGDLFETHPDSIRTWRNVDGTLTRIANQEVTNVYATFTGYLWRKNSDESEFWIAWQGKGVLPTKLIRLGEVLLTYAEASIELNRIDETVYKAINDLRDRAGMARIATNLGQDALRKIVRHERKIELAGEGFRLYDIRRWKIAEYVIPGNLPGRKNKAYWYNPGIPNFNEFGHPTYSNQSQIFKTIQVRRFDKGRDYLWAIPQSERDLNSNLSQNNGY